MNKEVEAILMEEPVAVVLVAVVVVQVVRVRVLVIQAETASG